MSLERYIEDVDFANDLVHTELFRPPYARITPAQARFLGQRYKLVMWDILSRDYNRMPVAPHLPAERDQIPARRSTSTRLITNYDLMADGQIVEVMFHTEKETVLSAELPPIVDMEVTYTEPGVKGDTASTNSLKPATVNTGATVRVPLFINTGDKIRVDTRTREYYERIKVSRQCSGRGCLTSPENRKSPLSE